MNTKRCTVETIEPEPEDPHNAACKDQRRKQKEEAGVQFCPKPPIEQPEPPPECLGICIEKVKNPPVVLGPKGYIRCQVIPSVTGEKRCEAILAVTQTKDTPWPHCPAPPTPPPEPEVDLCEELRRKAKKKECEERMKRYKE